MFMKHPVQILPYTSLNKHNYNNLKNNDCNDHTKVINQRSFRKDI